MSRLISFVTVVMLIAGCASQPSATNLAFGCPMGASNVKSMDELAAAKFERTGRLDGIAVVESRCAPQGEYLRINMTVKNDTRDPRRLAYKFRWLDRNGMLAADEEAWKPILVYGQSRYLVETVSPSIKAVDFKFLLMDQEER